MRKSEQFIYIIRLNSGHPKDSLNFMFSSYGGIVPARRDWMPQRSWNGIAPLWHRPKPGGDNPLGQYTNDLTADGVYIE
jgi:hypothetical protein